MFEVPAQAIDEGEIPADSVALTEVWGLADRLPATRPWLSQVAKASSWLTWDWTQAAALQSSTMDRQQGPRMLVAGIAHRQ